MDMQNPSKVRRPHSLVVRITPLHGVGLGANPGGVIYNMIDKERTDREKFVTIDNMRKLMRKAFSAGQDTGNDYPVKFWVEEEIYSYQNNKRWNKKKWEK